MIYRLAYLAGSVKSINIFVNLINDIKLHGHRLLALIKPFDGNCRLRLIFLLHSFESTGIKSDEVPIFRKGIQQD